MDAVSLPSDLEQFVADSVATGDFRDAGDVVAAGVRLLREFRAARADFVRSLEDAEAESERDGWFSLEDVMSDADAVRAGMSKAG